MTDPFSGLPLEERARLAAQTEERRKAYEKAERDRAEYAELEARRAELAEYVARRGGDYFELTGERPPARLVEEWKADFTSAKFAEGELDRAQLVEEAKEDSPF